MLPRDIPEQVTRLIELIKVRNSSDCMPYNSYTALYMAIVPAL